MKHNSNLEVTCILNYTFYHFQIKTGYINKLKFYILKIIKMVNFTYILLCYGHISI